MVGVELSSVNSTCCSRIMRAKFNQALAQSFASSQRPTLSSKHLCSNKLVLLRPTIWHPLILAITQRTRMLPGVFSLVAPPQMHFGLEIVKLLNASTGCLLA